jgi:diguanylate cyclase (GGDEF)-like protein
VPLRVRLSLAFVIIVLVPLGVTAVLIEVVLAHNLDTSTRERLSHGTQYVSSIVQQYEKRAQESALAVSSTPGLQDAVRDGRADVARGIVAKHVEATRGAGVDADFTAIVGPDGKEIASFGRPPQFRSGTTLPSVASFAPETARSPYAVVGRSLLLLQGADAKDLGTVVSGFWLDDATLRQIMSGVGKVDLTVRADGRPVASTMSDDDRVATLAGAKPSGVPRRMGQLFVSRVPVGSFDVVLTTERRSLIDQQRDLGPILVLIVLLFVSLAALLGWLLARLTTKPLQELSEAALDIASGQHDTRIVVPPSGEVGRLAIAFNAMADELTSNNAELESSRDELRRNLTRLGETLTSTHDLNKMLDVVLETAKVTLRAEAGALMLYTASRDELYIKSWLGDPERRGDGTGRVKLGEGVAGMVGRTEEPLHGLVTGKPGGLKLADGEPRARSVIAVPLKAHGRTLGVLNLYDKEGSGDFDADDFTTIRSFANQATVAIDNVLLHQESQRLSITDGLTGLWNYRYFQMMFDKEIERASRFGRPLSLLMLDLDKFKDVNDTHGHQRGDSVLIELATRIKGGIREVDILARYGGEEFVLILPETDLLGAEQAAGKLCELVRQRSFGNTDETTLRLTVSIGVAVYPEHGSTPSMLVKAADAALYVAKSEGRDRYSVGGPGADEADTVPRLPPLDGHTRSALESAAASVGTTRPPDVDNPLGTA